MNIKYSWMLVFILLVLSCSDTEEKVITRKGNRILIAQQVRAGSDKAVSYDNSKLAYTTYTGTMFKSHYTLYVNDNKIYSAERISNLIFSFDSRHLAFAAKKSKDRAFVILDGVPLGEYNDIGAKTLVFSPDSSKLAYCAKKNNKWFVAICDIASRNLTVSRSYEDVGSKVTFSPDSRRLSYNVKHSGKWMVVIDGVAHEPFQEIGRGSFVFSPNSENFAFAAKLDNRWMVVRDDHQGPMYDGILGYSLLFSPDGNHFAYAAGAAGSQFVVIDGIPQKKYRNIVFRSLTFSRDGKRFGYAAYDGNGWFVVVDGEEGNRHEGVFSGPIFAPDGNNYAYVSGRKALIGMKYGFVIQESGKKTQKYDAILIETVSFSPNGRSLAFVARRGGIFSGKYFLVVNEGEGADYDDVLSLDFQNLGFGSLLEFRRWYGFKKQIAPWESNKKVSYMAQEGENVYLVQELVTENDNDS